MDLNKLVKDWGEILNEGKKIKSQKVLKATALMLENEQNYLKESGNYSVIGRQLDAGYAGSGDFHQIAIPMVRRTFPELLAHEIVGVQPMTGPVGLAFALRFRAGQTYGGSENVELGYNAIDPDYTGNNLPSGAMATSAGEGLGSDTIPANIGGTGLGIANTGAIREVNMTVEKAQVEAKTRKLRSRWSLEVAQDLKAMHGLDLEEEMLDILAYEITAEIDRELVNRINGIAQQSTWDYDDLEGLADGRWMSEKYRTLYNHILRMSNKIAIRTRRGAGNFLIASPYVCAALETLSSFVIHPVDNDLNTNVAGIAKMGSLDGRITVYRDTFATGDYCTVGYKGPSEYDSGIIYLPYIQLMVSKTVFEQSFHPTVGLMSRYAIHDHIFGANLYYQKIIVANLPGGQSGQIV